MNTQQLMLQQRYAKLTASINTRAGFPKHNQIRIVELSDGFCLGELQITSDSLNSLGIVHGGALFSLADTVSAMAVCTRAARTVTVDSRFRFLRTPAGGPIRCTATPLGGQGNTLVFRCSLTDETSAEVAAGEFTFLLLDP